MKPELAGNLGGRRLFFNLWLKTLFFAFALSHFILPSTETRILAYFYWKVTVFCGSMRGVDFLHSCNEQVMTTLYVEVFVQHL